MMLTNLCLIITLNVASFNMHCFIVPQKSENRGDTEASDIHSLIVAVTSGRKIKCLRNKLDINDFLVKLQVKLWLPIEKRVESMEEGREQVVVGNRGGDVQHGGNYIEHKSENASGHDRNVLGGNVVEDVTKVEREGDGEEIPMEHYEFDLPHIEIYVNMGETGNVRDPTAYNHVEVDIDDATEEHAILEEDEVGVEEEVRELPGVECQDSRGRLVSNNSCTAPLLSV